jgi:hypothetical protein
MTARSDGDTTPSESDTAAGPGHSGGGSRTGVYLLAVGLVVMLAGLLFGYGQRRQRLSRSLAMWVTWISSVPA